MSTTRGYGNSPLYEANKKKSLFSKRSFRSSSQPDFSLLNQETSQYDSANQALQQSISQGAIPGQNSSSGYYTQMIPPESAPAQPVIYEGSYSSPNFSYAQNAQSYQGASGFQSTQTYPGAQPFQSSQSFPNAQPFQSVQPYQNAQPYPDAQQSFSQPAFSYNVNGTVPAFAAAAQRDSGAFGQAPVTQMTYDTFHTDPTPTTVQQPSASAARASREKKPASDEQVSQRAWAVYLFGFIPLLFIPCLFVTGSLRMLRLVFIGLCAVSLVLMWRKRLFHASVRLIVSLVYVAMCALLVLMLVPESDSTRQSGAQSSVPYGGGAYTQTVSSSVYPEQDLLMPEVVLTPGPTEVVISEAEIRLSAFMDEWSANNYTNMLNYTQPSWRNAQSDAATSLFTVIANRTPKSYNIEEVGGTDEETSRTISMTASIDKNNGKACTTFRFSVMMVKEGDSWYVNPNSLASNDSLKSTSSEENTVNNTTSNITVTAAPRTTVTPEPPASTTLYYNPDGGSYYHIDQYCPSVKSEFLPLTGTFAYRELKTYQNQYNLSPCLKCGAPINPPSGE